MSHDEDFRLPLVEASDVIGLMNPTFDRLYRQLARTTFGMLVAVISVYGAAIVLALLGARHAAESLCQVSFSLAYAFAALLLVFLASSLVAAVLRWISRRSAKAE